MTSSRMAAEIAEIPDCVTRQRGEGREVLDAAGVAMRRLAPRFLATVARGSSDHAATYLKTLVEMRARVPVASLTPSTASVYGVDLMLDGAAAIAISQSGASPDLLATMAMARRGGAETFAIVNAPDAPLARDGARVLPIAAGPERAVAATKSFVGSLTAAAGLVAAWTGDGELEDALDRLPDVLGCAVATDWDAALEAFTSIGSAFVLGRGPSLGLAGEAALKCKECCELHAEGYSAAEVLHGPLQLAAGPLVVLVFAADGPTRDSTGHAIARLVDAGARVLVADAGRDPGFDGTTTLPTVRAGHPLLEPVAQAASFYRFVEALARTRGHDPDAPSLLAKVTRTR